MTEILFYYLLAGCPWTLYAAGTHFELHRSENLKKCVILNWILWPFATLWATVNRPRRRPPAPDLGRSSPIRTTEFI